MWRSRLRYTCKYNVVDGSSNGTSRFLRSTNARLISRLQLSSGFHILSFVKVAYLMYCIK